MLLTFSGKYIVNYLWESWYT